MVAYIALAVAIIALALAIYNHLLIREVAKQASLEVARVRTRYDHLYGQVAGNLSNHISSRAHRG